MEYLIIGLILAAAISYVIYSLKKEVTDGCSGCSGGCGNTTDDKDANSCDTFIPFPPPSKKDTNEKDTDE